MRIRNPPGRITPGVLVLLGALTGGGWLLMQPQEQRTSMTCNSVSKLTEWVRGDKAAMSEWDIKVKEAMDTLKLNCREVLDKQVAPVVDKAVGTAKGQAGTALHLSVGTANQLRSGRRITAVIDGRTLKVSGVGIARLLGITVPEDKNEAAKEFLVECCLKQQLPVQKYDEKDAEGYPLVVVFLPENIKQELTPGMAVNQHMLDKGLAGPWILPVHTTNWSNVPTADARQP